MTVLTLNQKMLSGLEEEVVEGFGSAARALRRIKESNYYKEQYGTWENYLDQRWGYSNDHWQRLLQASGVIEILTMHNVHSLPTNNRQTSELAPLDPIQQVQVWQEVTDRYEPKQITAAKIQEVKEEILTPDVEVIDNSQPNSNGIEKRFEIMADTGDEEIEMMQVMYKKAIELRAGKKYTDWLSRFIIYKIGDLEIKQANNN